MKTRRRLAVILASDVAGYSRLVADAEEDTIARFQHAAGVLRELVDKHHGRIFNTAGDAILAEFDSAVEATRCAVDFQDASNSWNDAVPQDRLLQFRIGLAVGDVVVTESGDLLGDGVNVAARLQTLAHPGGICVSEDVRSHVSRKLSVRFQDIGEQALRNIEPVRVFRIASPRTGEDAPPRGRAERPAWMAAAIGAGVVVLAVLAGLFWYRGSATREIGPPGLASQEFDAALVPLVDDSVRTTLASYPTLPGAKAIAISTDHWGMASGAADIESAKRDALERCQAAAKRPCRLYAVGSDVVWPQRSWRIGPADLRVTPSAIPVEQAAFAFLGENGRQQLADRYLARPDHRAVALSTSHSGFSIVNGRSSRAEAIRLALERCEDYRQVPCLLVSVDGYLTTPIPKSRRVTDIFMLAADPDIPAGDAQRLTRIYEGADWRAMARSTGGSWHAVAGAASEEAAVEAALKACSQSAGTCSIHAIGNFRVADK